MAMVGGKALLLGVSLMLPCAAMAQAPAKVLTGIDVLEETRFAALRTLVAEKKDHRLRLGVVTNQSAVDRSGRRTLDVLYGEARRAVPGLEIDAVFSPEHGIAGTADTAHANGGRDYRIEDSRDPATGLRVTSLFGNTDAERRPKLDQMHGLDAVVIDLQDVGVHFYTYETVVGYFLEAAARTGTRVLVLDRPNPLGGETVQGAVSPDRPEYINYMPLPVRHGMTMGELARLFRARKSPGASLAVIRMRGWLRSMWFDETGLPWVNPSPNLRSMEAVTLYPGTGLLEGANVSVGRGSDLTFEKIGAPWIDGAVLLAALQKAAPRGVRFHRTDFTPAAPFKLAGEACHGVRIEITDRNALDSPALGVLLASTLHSLYSDQFQLSGIDPIKADDETMQGVRAGTSVASLASRWKESDKRFRDSVRRYLLYPETR